MHFGLMKNYVRHKRAPNGGAHPISEILHINNRAITIIYKNLDNQEALTIAGLPTVKQRRIDMCKKLFIKIQNENHRLHKLLPAKKENCHCL